MRAETGRAAQLLRAYDWASTPLGPIAAWPAALSTAVQMVLASGHAMCLAWGPERTLIYNDAYIPMLGRRHPAALGARLADAWPDVWDEIAPLVEATFRGETATFQDFPLAMTRNGVAEDTWWTFSYSPVRGDGGEVAGMLNVTLETTAGVLAQRERDAALRSLRANEAKLRALVVASSDAVYSMNPDWTEMRQLEGRGFLADTASPIAGWADAYLFPEDRAAVLAAAGAAIADRSVFEMEHRIRRGDGAAGWAFSRAVPVLDDDGRIQEWFGMAADTSERHASEAALLASRNALQQLNATLEQRIEERSRELVAAEDQVRQLQKLEAIGQLTGGVAHDFNNLLTIIRSSAELLRRQEHLPAEKRRRYVDAIADTADRAARLTGQLLAFARRQALSPEVFDVAAKVAGVCEMLRTVVGPRIAIAVRGPAAPVFVEVDANQFETALVNLVVNARDAMDGDGALTIGIDAAEAPPRDGGAPARGQAVVSVRDTGTGIAPERMDRIFEPFYTTKPLGKGTGLGLSQVYGFVKQSGGDVAVESAPGAGTTVRLQLPMAAAPLAAAAPAGRTEAKPADRCSVLVVEDDAQVGEFATRLLADLGYRTRHAAHAAQALAILEEHHASIDIVFSDVVMPGMGGVALGQRVRERWPGLAVVLTSGYSHVLAEDARHGFAVLRKPYSVEELSRVLGKARGRAD